MDAPQFGYRFHPSDEELVDHFLKLKVLGNDDLVSKIPELNIWNYDPWNLPQNSVMTVPKDSNEEVCYFFCPQIHQGSNGQRVNRRSSTGYWKPTGMARKIKEIGTKRTLVFYQVAADRRGIRTNCIIHEYTPTFNFHAQRDFVLCKLKRTRDADNGVASQEQVNESSTLMVGDAETPNVSA